jgi:hypothetical protein
MRTLCFAVSVVVVALFLGCGAPDDVASRGFQNRYVTTYYDRNHDGVVDFELHNVPGAADAAWALSDTKFRGHYDVRLKFGYVFQREKVNLPVPKNVKITPGEPPVFTTR